jgi:hypothetical protein
MIEIHTNEFPPFLEEEFGRMMIPGDGDGFAITHTSLKGKECVTCGLISGRVVSVRYSGAGYAFSGRRSISISEFDLLCGAVPTEVRRSGFLAAEDILDGESYLIKWSRDNETTRLVLSNPRQIENEVIRRLACRLDDLMRKCS